MTYTLTICFGMFLSLCGSVRTFDYPTFDLCEKARASISAKNLGDGYAICSAKNSGDKK